MLVLAFVNLFLSCSYIMSGESLNLGEMATALFCICVWEESF
jgi:hypothetical protein